jgi:hypothetical protein
MAYVTGIIKEILVCTYTALRAQVRVVSLYTNFKKSLAKL